MSVRDVRWLLQGYLPTACVVTVAGLLHRRAAVDAWADDRSLAADPSWLQMAAPLWHSAVHGSMSIANGLVRLIDPLTGASTAGDTRALAAALTALSAGALFLVLRRAGVSLLIATSLSGATVASLLPVAVAASVSHALLMLLGTALILTWSVSSSANRLRVGLLAAITALGAFTHAAFLAFAAGIWIVEWVVVGKRSRARLAVIGVGALAASLIGSSWLLAQHGAAPFDMAIERPSTFAMAAGLLTGRFDPHLQPSQMLDVLSALSASVPAPMILSVPLAALAFVRRETRDLAFACALAMAVLVSFLWGTWLPDPRIAGAPARLAVVVLIGLGLSWVAAQPGKRAMTLAVLAGVLIGLRGFVEPTHWSVPVKTAQVQAFVEAAPKVVEHAAWSVDRLAVSRALVAAQDELTRSRVPIGANALAAVPHDRPVVVIGSLERRSTSIGEWTIPFDVSYPSAARFLAAQPGRLWMTVAVHGPAADGFCGDLFARLSGDPSVLRAVNPTLLARVGDRNPRVSLTASDRLDVEYGRMLAGTPEPVPARVVIEATASARILINRQVAAQADHGMAIATFDPWTADTENWIVGPCDRPVLPTIRDPRLAASYMMESDGRARPPSIPALASTPVQVRLDIGEWFGRGWHDREGSGEDAFRWTRELDAHVNVPVTRAQPLRVRMDTALATAPGVPNALGVSWNGHVVRPLGPWPDSHDGEWIVPESVVRRGINDFTIHVAHLVSPAASGGSTDTRTLGAVIRRLSIEPITPAARE